MSIHKSAECRLNEFVRFMRAFFSPGDLLEPDLNRILSCEFTEKFGRMDSINIHGSRKLNLKNIDFDLPRDKLIVASGLFGSGKSSPLRFLRFKLKASTIK